MELILKRRSIRKYQKREVSEAQIKSILEAGMNAPSAGNERPWRFIVVRDKKKLKELEGVSPYSKMIGEAAAAIVVLGDLNLEVYKGFWVQDCSAAIENMLLTVAEMKLGSVWLGVYPMENRTSYVKSLFLLPDSIIPLAILPIGYPDEEPEPVNRYDEKRISFETYQPEKKE